MSNAHDDEGPHDATDLEEWEEDEEARTGVFQTFWFRLLLVLVVVGGAAAVSAPYMLSSSPPVPDSGSRVAQPVPASPSPEAVTGIPTRAAEPIPPVTDVVAPGPAAAGSTSTERPAPAAEPSAPPADRKVFAESRLASPERNTPAADRKTAALKSAPRPVAKAAPTRARSQASESVSAPAATPAQPRSEPGVGSAKAAPPSQQPLRTPQTIGGDHGDHWVQVGAFRDPSAARQLAARLREQHFRVEESLARPPAPRAVGSEERARYMVVVPTSAPDEAMSRLRALGVAAEPAADGAVVTPTLPLQEAVALAKTITGDGLRVQVRRASAPAVAASPVTGPDVLHRVRVGAFQDRASALVAARALEDRGYQPFITREAR